MQLRRSVGIGEGERLTVVMVDLFVSYFSPLTFKLLHPFVGRGRGSGRHRRGSD